MEQKTIRARCIELYDDQGKRRVVLESGRAGRGRQPYICGDADREAGERSALLLAEHRRRCGDHDHLWRIGATEDRHAWRGRL